MSAITDFHGNYFYLSNFFTSAIIFDGETYSTIEHTFQAAKTFDPEQRQAIQNANTPAAAKRLGRQVALRPDWEEVKFDIMRDLLKQKFSQSDLRQKLIATGEVELIEGNTWGDRVWGCVLVKGQWVGKNHLGRLLMEIRSEIQREHRENPTGTKAEQSENES